MTQPRTDNVPAVIVAAAVLDDRGRVLAAQRSYPAHLAGYWEFPGGKVEPGERDEDALVREFSEELGTTIDLAERIGGDWPVLEGYVLRLWTARLAPAAPEPRPLEHAALDWVPPESLHQVDWLPSDRAITAHLQAVLLGQP
ncbi:MAG: (deoxy)nucleoside triphosphate pyrophosphohydrolase [Streptosporangiales bacterium]